MKFLKTILITALALLLTGCYTQLQYSQTMKKITDEKPTKEAGVYAWSGEEKAEKSVQTNEQPADEYAEYQNEGEEYIPIYYKDYEYATKYGNVYNVNNYYGYDWYDYYRPYSSFHSFYFDRWFYRNYYRPWYPRSSFAFSFSIGWGNPYFYSPYRYNHFYDPFFSPFDYYWYGIYSSPYAFNYGYYYGKSGYGYGYYPDSKKRESQNVRYGPRSIGTNRVATDGNNNRSRTVTDGRATSVSKSTSSTVRTRSTSGTVNRTSSDNNSNPSARTRSRDNNNRIDNSFSSGDYDRNRSDEMPIVIDEERMKQIKEQVNNNRSQLNSSRERTPTFFDRMRSFFREGTTRISNGSNNRSIRTRSNFPSTNRSKVNRSSSSSRSSVNKSNSSSNNTRSRGSSSSSRSRSDNSSSSSGSDRSRGN